MEVIVSKSTPHAPVSSPTSHVVSPNDDAARLGSAISSMHSSMMSGLLSQPHQPSGNAATVTATVTTTITATVTTTAKPTIAPADTSSPSSSAAAAQSEIPSASRAPEATKPSEVMSRSATFWNAFRLALGLKYWPHGDGAGSPSTSSTSDSHSPTTKSPIVVAAVRAGLWHTPTTPTNAFLDAVTRRMKLRASSSRTIKAIGSNETTDTYDSAAATNTGTLPSSTSADSSPTALVDRAHGPIAAVSAAMQRIRDHAWALPTNGSRSSSTVSTANTTFPKASPIATRVTMNALWPIVKPRAGTLSHFDATNATSHSLRNGTALLDGLKSHAIYADEILANVFWCAVYLFVGFSAMAFLSILLEAMGMPPQEAS